MPDPDAYNGMFYRSDHFPFVKKGIPAMFAKGWNDNRIHGKEWSKEQIARYWAEVYHKPTRPVPRTITADCSRKYICSLTSDMSWLREPAIHGGIRGRSLRGYWRGKKKVMPIAPRHSL